MKATEKPAVEAVPTEGEASTEEPIKAEDGQEVGGDTEQDATTTELNTSTASVPGTPGTPGEGKIQMVMDVFKCIHCALERSLDLDSPEMEEFSFKSKMMLRQHMIEVHSTTRTDSPAGTNTIDCLRCDKNFKSKDDYSYIYRYLNHMEFDHQLVYYKYGDPKRYRKSAKYDSRSMVQWGKHDRFDEVLYLCVFCHHNRLNEGKTEQIEQSEFMDRAGLISHIETTHVAIADAQLNLQCPLCPFSAKTSRDLGFLEQLISRILHHVEEQHLVIYFYPEEELAKLIQDGSQREERDYATGKESAEESSGSEEDEVDEDGNYKPPKPKKRGRGRRPKREVKLPARLNDNCKCAMCHLEFPDEAELKQHLQNAHPQSTNIFCETCGDSCFTEKEYHRHAWLRHRENLTGRPMEKCVTCGGEVPDVAMSLHMRRHLISSHQCELCGMEIMGEANLRKHQANHKMKGALGCPECGQIFVSKYRLKSHMAGAHGVQRFKCKHCKTRADSAEQLQKHMNRSHPNGTNLNYCEICKRQLVDVYSYENHMFVTHKVNISKKRQIETCPTCQFQTLGMVMMRKHLKIHQEAEAPSVAKCLVCDIVFENKTLLRKHTEEYHVTMRFDCPEASCNESFIRKYFLIRHIAKYHRYLDGLIYCPSCPYATTNPNSFHAHNLKKHNIGREEEMAMVEEIARKEAMPKQVVKQKPRRKKKRHHRPPQETIILGDPKKQQETLILTDPINIQYFQDSGAMETAVVKMDPADMAEAGYSTQSIVVNTAGEPVEGIPQLVDLSGSQLVEQMTFEDGENTEEVVHALQGLATTTDGKSGAQPKAQKVLLWDGQKTVEVQLGDQEEVAMETVETITTEEAEPVVEETVELPPEAEGQEKQYEFTIDNEPGVQYVVYM